MTTHTDHDTSEHPGLDEPRPGQELRVARERAGIGREYMAERLRLALAQFDALEHDDYAELPPPAFVRGYFRTYARELGLDPDEYVDAYNRSGVSSQDPEIRRGGVTESTPGGRSGMVGLLLIALVAAGGIGAWWYQQRMVDHSGGSGASDSVEEEPAGADDSATGIGDSQEPAGDDADTGDSGAGTDEGGDAAVSAEGDRDADDVSATADDADTDPNADPNGDTDTDTGTAAVDVEAAGATVAAEDGGDDEAEQPTVATPERKSPESGGDGSAGDATGIAEAGDLGSGTEEDDADDDAAVAPEGGENDGAESAANDEPGSTSPAATDSPARVATEAAGTGPDEITLEFSARSWLEVYDDRERELAYTLYFGSEPVTLQGWAPFEIFLGDSPAVDVQFNGEEIDKSAFTRSNNTARFVVDASGVRAP